MEHAGSVLQREIRVNVCGRKVQIYYAVRNIETPKQELSE